MTTQPLLCVQATPSAPPCPDTLSGWHLTQVSDLDSARAHIASERYLLGLLTLDATDRTTLKRIEHALTRSPQVEWVALVKDEPLDHELRHFISRNCYDYHTTPVDFDRLLITLGHAFGMAQLRAQFGNARECHDPNDFEMVGASRQMQNVFHAIRKIARVDAPVLLVGESGTGKELAARAIHERSVRAQAPFIAVNCGALPSTLIHSELFGHEKGAFTDARSRKIGRIEAAEGGTIFLDEVGDLPQDMQVTLLRFLQEKTIERLGSTQPISINARVIAATHVDLERAVAEGLFREDLYYRLNVLRLTMPPLRERAGDVELLARFFFNEFVGESQNKIAGFSQEALDCMRRHNWPGNVRELINRVRRALVMCEDRLISPIDMGLEQRAGGRPAHTLEMARVLADIQAIQEALFRNNNNVTRTAKDLDISRITLYRLMEKYDIPGLMESSRQRIVSEN